MLSTLSTSTEEEEKIRDKKQLLEMIEMKMTKLELLITIQFDKISERIDHIHQKSIEMEKNLLKQQEVKYLNTY